MNIIGRRRLWFTISIIAIVPGVISLLLWGLKPGIDFTGGQEIELKNAPSQEAVTKILQTAGARDITVTTSGNNMVLVRYAAEEKADPNELHQKIKASLAKDKIDEVSYNSVGPSVSRDIVRNAILSLVFVSLAIVLYIAIAFRNVPPPVSSWSFGVTAIIALLHDALFVIGIFSILGHFFGVQVDSLFVTAILTVIGFSVHDTIVVYDRIRENLRRYNKPLEVIINDSILETFARSVNTSITVFLTLFALFLFGGASIRFFVLALLIGVVSGTYSSIFNASPMLLVYNNWKIKRKSKA